MAAKGQLGGHEMLECPRPGDGGIKLHMITLHKAACAHAHAHGRARIPGGTRSSGDRSTVKPLILLSHPRQTALALGVPRGRMRRPSSHSFFPPTCFEPTIISK